MSLNWFAETDSYTGGSSHMGSRFGPADSNCRLYIGNITRNITPEKSENAESEIKAAFESSDFNFVCNSGFVVPLGQFWAKVLIVWSNYCP